MTIQDLPANRTVIELLPEPGQWTEAAYYFVSERGRLVELTNGNLEILPMPTDFHQLISARLFAVLFAYVEQRKLGQVRYAPLPVRLWPGKIREPDLMFMSKAHLNRIEKYWGVPDLAVEIISEGEEKRDREDKRVEYAQAGVLEYWIIDPQQKTVDVLRLLSERKEFELIERYTETGKLASPLFPEIEYAIADLFAPA